MFTVNPVLNLSLLTVLPLIYVYCLSYPYFKFTVIPVLILSLLSVLVLFKFSDSPVLILHLLLELPLI
jgi:hypothetical protein